LTLLTILIYKNMQISGNFRLRVLVILGVLLCFSTLLTAQQKIITGIVKDQKGEPIIGATIVGKGTSLGTLSDADGKFKLSLPVNINVLSVSYLGMKALDINLKGNTVEVTLLEDELLLGEVVVIGYGTQRKKDLTGAVSSVNEKALKDIPVSTIAEALTGKLAGVQVTTTEGGN
jgi:hypothetical protein